MATSDAAKAAAFAKTGKRVTEFCATCHGENGNSKKSDIPNLAGQNVTYVFEQMRKFINGERNDETHSKFMGRLLKAMTEDERAAAAYHYSREKTVAARTVAGPLAAAGQAIYTARCLQCHGDKGLGAEIIPRIAGQQPQYLKISLDRYRKKSGARQFATMSEAVGTLSDRDIDGVVDYLSSLQ